VRDFFPNAASLDAPASTSATQAVRDASGTVLGLVTQTSPDSDRIIGYSGPSNLLIVMNPRGVVTGLRVLHSSDTPDHVAEVIAHRPFFRQFNDMQMGHLKPQQIDGVTGATLTSGAMAEGILRKLGRQGPSLRFPAAITLDEVKSLEPTASSLRDSQLLADSLEVLDPAGQVIAIAARTAPITDTLVGYKGPTDTLMLLDPTGTTLRGIRLRKSYDTARYVAYVTGDDYFLKLFNGKTLDQLAGLDFKAAKIEGVSGATETSWSVAEGIKQRAASLLDEHSPALSFLKTIRWRWQDTGHGLVLLSSLVMAFTRWRGIAWLRHAHHILLVIYVGFISGELLSQALFAGWAQHGTPWRSAPGLVILSLFALLAPVVTRRQLYCHHICPHGALQQLVMKRAPWQFTAPRWLEKLPFILLGLVVFIVTTGLNIDLNALEPFDAYVWRVAGIASLVIAATGLIASCFVPMAYCKYGCPTGALFKLLRSAGDQESFGKREWLALVIVAAIALWRWSHGS
jgi:Na+-translocating ferredoxin:NAD+ oxidoreductase RnfG subunit